MKHLIIILLLLSFFTDKGLTQNDLTGKSATFKKYQLDNAYKGIHFGTKLRETDVKLDLEVSSFFFVNTFKIGSSLFRQYAGIQFGAAEAYFTDDAEFYQVLIHEDSLKDGLIFYLALKDIFLKLFGKNDTERADIPTRMIGWHGPVVSISLMFDPYNDKSKDGHVSIMIYNNELNSKSQDQRFKGSKKRINYDDPVPEI